MKWSDIDYEETRIHIQRNAVKITGEDIIAKDTKTAAWDRYVYFSPETEGLLKEYRRECVWHADAYENHTVFFHPSRPTHGPAGTGPPAR